MSGLKKNSLKCPTSEIVCFPVLISTYSHVENFLFSRKHTNWYVLFGR